MPIMSLITANPLTWPRWEDANLVHYCAINHFLCGDFSLNNLCHFITKDIRSDGHKSCSRVGFKSEVRWSEMYPTSKWIMSVRLKQGQGTFIFSRKTTMRDYDIDFFFIKYECNKKKLVVKSRTFFHHRRSVLWLAEGQRRSAKGQ